MTLTEILAQGTPKLIALDEWTYEGEPTGLRVAALANSKDEHRATIIVEPNTQMVLALELFTPDGTVIWREIEFNLPLEGTLVSANQALLILNHLMIAEDDPA